MGEKNQGADRTNGVIVQRARATHLRLDVLRGASGSGTLGISFPLVRGSRSRYAAGARHGARNCIGGLTLTNTKGHQIASNRIVSFGEWRRARIPIFFARSITREHAPNSDRGNQRFPGSPLFFESVITAVDGPFNQLVRESKIPENRESFWPRIRSRAISQGRRLTPRLSRGPRGRIIHADPTLPTIH